MNNFLFLVLSFRIHRKTTSEMQMSSNNNEEIHRILNRLKLGSILTKRKRNGEKYSRQFYLDLHEGFISYRQSEKVFAQSHRCKEEIFFGMFHRSSR